MGLNYSQIHTQTGREIIERKVILCGQGNKANMEIMEYQNKTSYLGTDFTFSVHFM